MKFHTENAVTDAYSISYVSYRIADKGVDKPRTGRGQLWTRSQIFEAAKTV